MKKNTILIVDDAQIHREVLKHIIEELGFCTEICSDGVQAIEHLSTHRDVIAAAFIDVYMPEIDGISVLGHSRRHYPDLPVYIITGSDDETEERVSYELGAAGFIKKPTRIEDLRDPIHEALKKLSTAN